MTSKHPVTTEAVALDISDDPELVHWKRRPYETDFDGSTPSAPKRAFEATKPSSPIPHDLEFDAKTSDTYQSLTEVAPRMQYENAFSRGGKRASAARPPPFACMKCHMYFLTVFVLVLCVILCCGIALVGYGLFTDDTPQNNEERVSELETQLFEARESIDQLNSLLEKLHSNISTNARKNDELSVQVGTLSESVGDIRNQLNDSANASNLTTPETPTSQPKTVDLYRDCNITQQVQKCFISQAIEDMTDTTDLNNLYPGYTNCNTVGTDFNVTGTYILDIQCAISNNRGETNPQIATLHIRRDLNKVQCLCFVTAFQARRGVVDCSLYITRCPSSQVI